MSFRDPKVIKKPASFIANKSKELAMDKLHLHEKFTKENFLNLCSLRWSEWGRWRRFFVIAGAIAAIVVSAPSFVMILPCVTVFYLISCTVKNAVEIVSNWKWGPIFPKKKIKRDEILNEIEQDNERQEKTLEKGTKLEDYHQEEDEKDEFLESLESINGDEEDLEEIEESEFTNDKVDEFEGEEDEEIELPTEKEALDEKIDSEEAEEVSEEDLEEEEDFSQENILIDEEAYRDAKDAREESSK